MLVASSAPRSDPTVELSINDLMTIARPSPKRPQQPPTMELSISDVAVVVGKGAGKNGVGAQAAAHSAAAVAARGRAGADAAGAALGVGRAGAGAAQPAGRRRARALPTSARRLARCGKRAPAISTRRSRRWRARSSSTPINEDARRALERLAESNGAWDAAGGRARRDHRGDRQRRARGAPARSIRRACASSKATLADAEARYQRALGMRPDDEAAMSRLEAVYRQSERWGELATLLERRLHGLMERMPPSRGAQGCARSSWPTCTSAWATPTRPSTPGRTWRASIRIMRRRSPIWRGCTRPSGSGRR